MTATASMTPVQSHGEVCNGAQAWRDNLPLVQRRLPFTRRVVHAGDAIYEGGAPFGHLHLINSGQFKTVNFTADGRGQVVGLHFRGDWLGFDRADPEPGAGGHFARDPGAGRHHERTGGPH